MRGFLIIKIKQKMEKVCVGIDISMDDFHCCIRTRSEIDHRVIASGTFTNDHKGFDKFLKWVSVHVKHYGELSFVMEATGVYYENLAYFLFEQGLDVYVVLANKVKNYIKSLNIKTKTDAVDSKYIAQLGLERALDRWEPMSTQYKELRDLCREMLSLKKDMQRSKCQLHALKFANQKSTLIIKLKTEQINFYETSIKAIKKEIKKAAMKDPLLAQRIAKLETIPGVGFETIIVLLSETNGFSLIKNEKQLVSYAGLDVTFNESGTYKGKTRISKRGNTRIRQALYMPALSGIRANKPIKQLYERVCERNPDAKKKGVVAGMRKLLLITYVLWRKDQIYDENYNWTISQATIEEPVTCQ